MVFILTVVSRSAMNIIENFRDFLRIEVLKNAKIFSYNFHDVYFWSQQFSQFLCCGGGEGKLRLMVEIVNF